MAIRIAILGWGSLLWDQCPQFDKHHGRWELDGPSLKIEFSRISQTRGGALTLVIDAKHGTSCQVAYSISKRQVAQEAIEDLREREGTTHANIGFHFPNGLGSQSRDAITLAAIRAWVASKGLDGVVWTDLASNFEKTKSRPFSIEAAVEHLRALDTREKLNAADYVLRAPEFVVTLVRDAIQAEPWCDS